MAEQAASFMVIREPDRDCDRPQALPWQEYHDHLMAAWFALLGDDPDELAVQKFLELHPAMIPGGSGDIGPGGHHGSEMNFVFREPNLKGVGPDYGPDFMWVTRSSGLVTPILVEIEKPSKRWFTKAGHPTAEFTAAHNQLNDWRNWFSRDGNAAGFRRRYLFSNDHSNRPLEPQYLLIYGRQSEFEHGGSHRNPDQLRSKRDGLRGGHEHFMTFDSLRPRYDHGSSITVTMTAEGVRPFAFSPVFGTSASNTGEAAELLGDPADALGRSELITPERKVYLAKRWDHWRNVRRAQREESRTTGYQLGLE